MTREVSPTRRGFLAAAGGTFLAGCGGLSGFSGDSETVISSYRLPDVTDDGKADPIVVEAIPVDIEQGQLAKRMRRVSDLLETVPVPLSPEKIPNGVIRHRLLDATNDATTSVQDARTAQTRFSALHALRQARENARYAAAGWAYVDSNLTKQELQAEHQQAIDDAQSLRTRLEYLGTDSVRAALVYAQIERNLELVLNDRPPHIHESSPLLTVAEWGEHATSTRALADDTHYLYDRYTTSLPETASPIKDTLATAAETLAEQLRNRRENLPPEPTESDGEDFEWRLRYRLRDDAEDSVRQITEAPGPARAVVTAVEGLTDFSAYERIQTQLKESDPFRIKEASDVREMRRQVLQAIRTALEQSPRPALARPVLADTAAAVSYADEELARYRGEVRVARLNDPIRRYVTAAARARSVPTACQHVIDALKQ